MKKQTKRKAERRLYVSLAKEHPIYKKYEKYLFWMDVMGAVDLGILHIFLRLIFAKSERSLWLTIGQYVNVREECRYDIYHEKFSERVVIQEVV